VLRRVKGGTVVELKTQAVRVEGHGEAGWAELAIIQARRYIRLGGRPVSAVSGTIVEFRRQALAGEIVHVEDYPLARCAAQASIIAIVLLIDVHDARADVNGPENAPGDPDYRASFTFRFV
jgi:hypothetical protein